MIMSSREIIKRLEQDDWFLVRVRGDHHIYKHPVKSGTVVVPHPRTDIPKGTAYAILKQAGLSS